MPPIVRAGTEPQNIANPHQQLLALIAGIVLVIIAALAFGAGITFCICKGGDVCDLCGG